MEKGTKPTSNASSDRRLTQKRLRNQIGLLLWLYNLEYFFVNAQTDMHCVLACVCQCPCFIALLKTHWQMALKRVLIIGVSVQLRYSFWKQKVFGGGGFWCTAKAFCKRCFSGTSYSSKREGMWEMNEEHWLSRMLSHQMILVDGEEHLGNRRTRKQEFKGHKHCVQGRQDLGTAYLTWYSREWFLVTASYLEVKCVVSEPKRRVSRAL